MKIARNIIFIGFLTLSAANLPAQTNFENIETEVTKILLKKDLRQAIKETESSPSSDLKSLFLRLSLYNRAADSEKVVLVVRQILNHADFNKNSVQHISYLQSFLKSDYFQDAATIQFFLQKGNFDGELFGKLIQICKNDKTACDIEEFDRFLGQKASEAEKKGATDNFFIDGFNWIGPQVDWRRHVGLDEKEITNRFVEAVRSNPSDLKAALRFIKFFKNSADIEWLGETFASTQAYDYYELGENIGRMTEFSSITSDEYHAIRRVAIRLLLKSLEMPFNEKDVSLMYAYHYRFVSVPVKIKNPEKQLRFWTKTALAKNYKNIKEPQNAQPIVEELAKLDKSDISDNNSAYLSGAVQAQSGARVVEAEILRRQAERQDSYQYWQERISYYTGRDETEQIFSSYLQSFSAVPFDLAKDGVKSPRIYYIRRFADFAREKLEYYCNGARTDDWNEQSERKYQLWKDAESFLRSEYERTKSNSKYSYELVEIIAGNRFRNLADDILSANPEILTKAAKDELLKSRQLTESFLKNPKIPQSKKDDVYAELLKIADSQSSPKAWFLFDMISTESANIYNPKFLPLVEKHFKRSLNLVKNYKPKGDDPDYSRLPEKYGEILFRSYLTANDHQSAEKLMIDGYYSLNYGYPMIIQNAAGNGAFEDAFQYWKKQSNLNRENLENLGYLKSFPQLAQKLREYYAQMKKDEPNSLVPDKALAILR